MSLPPDEVSYSDYRAACRHISGIGAAMEGADPDEAAEHWLPELTRHIAVVFAFVGVNATMRHTTLYAQTVADLQAAKDVHPQEE